MTASIYCPATVSGRTEENWLARTKARPCKNGYSIYVRQQRAERVHGQIDVRDCVNNPGTTITSSWFKSNEGCLPAALSSSMISSALGPTAPTAVNAASRNRHQSSDPALCASLDDVIVNERYDWIEGNVRDGKRSTRVSSKSQAATRTL
jgi:hypothetical protein